MNGIHLKGVRTHNLRHLDIDIPYQSLTVITGVSGSGKASLAFDTLYAEGQRRYVESISSYARQFLERMEKPDIETVRGILPSIAIEAKNVITNARSTVATQTELSDYLRLLFARIGQTYCPDCHTEVKIDSPESVVKTLFEKHESKSIAIGFQLKINPKNKRHLKSILHEYERQGFTQAVIDGHPIDLTQDKIPANGSDVWVQVDQLNVIGKNRPRLIESLETAFKYGHGETQVMIGSSRQHYSNQFACTSCARRFKQPSPNLFSFNSPLGACAACQGFGRIITIDWDLVIPDKKKSILEGAIHPWTKPSAAWEFKQLKAFCKRRSIPMHKPFDELSERHRHLILEGGEDEAYHSVKGFFRYLEKKTYKMHVRIFLSKYRGYHVCPDCSGTRLKPEALFVKVNGLDVAAISRFSIAALRQFFQEIHLNAYQEEIAAPILLEIRNRVRFLDEVGLGYLTLDRSSRTLSGGEAQRINLATSLGSALVETLYVLDEPSIGLHERDNQLLIRLLHELRDLGNTVVIVEHDRAMIEAADWVIDLGPLGGDEGGQMTFAGSFADLKHAESSMTGKYFRKQLVLNREILPANGNIEYTISVAGASHHNLKNLSVEIPLNRLVVMTGVSGSGKSTFLYDILYANYLRYRGRPVSEMGAVKRIEGFEHVRDLVLIDQSPIGRTPRSNPATYLKAFDDIRKVFARTRDAKVRKLTPSYFSFNVAGGRCERCRGEGSIKVEMHFLADVYMTCDYCQGSRYQKETLDIRYRDKNIQEVLNMPIDTALRHFEGERAIVEKLTILSQMGLGYLRLGQPATTLSGGEAQRMKLAAEMTNSKQENLLYLFDEPTTGLHYRDISYLLSAFDRLLERGHSICVIEHNMDVIKCADYVIDLGPEGGDQGGRLVFAGTVKQLLRQNASHTGVYLKR